MGEGKENWGIELEFLLLSTTLIRATRGDFFTATSRNGLVQGRVRNGPVESAWNKYMVNWSRWLLRLLRRVLVDP